MKQLNCSSPYAYMKQIKIYIELPIGVRTLTESGVFLGSFFCIIWSEFKEFEFGVSF